MTRIELSVSARNNLFNFACNNYVGLSCSWHRYMNGLSWIDRQQVSFHHWLQDKHPEVVVAWRLTQGGKYE